MDLVNLDALCSDLTVAAKTFQSLCDTYGTIDTTTGETVQDLITIASDINDPCNDIAVARRNLCGIASRLQILLASPTCFIRRIATQNQLLGCLRWLGEFQVLAYIPLCDSISFEELATLADVSEHTLSRTVRMMATAGFLHEPQVGYVAHTPLSSAFTNDLHHFDAIMFLANRVAPSALQMIEIAQKNGDGTMTSMRSQSLATNIAREPQLNRQWMAYQHSIGTPDNDLGALLSLLNWKSLGDASVVHICDRYTTSSQTLAHVSQGIRITVQTYDTHGADCAANRNGDDSLDPSMKHRIALQRRKPASTQPVKDAAVYILQPSFTAMNTNSYTPHELLLFELRAHFEVLQGNMTALLILAPTMLPEPGSVAINLEVQARLLDFAEMQLNSKSAVEVTELFKMTESICDGQGRLMVINRLRSADGATIALAVKYQLFKDLDELAWT